MGFLSGFLKKLEYKTPEEKYVVIISEDSVKVEHPRRATEEKRWNEINAIKLITTDDGPFAPDVWLALIGDESGCLIPQGADGFEEVFEIVSKYNNFNFENFIKSMTCTDNAEFELWIRKD